MIKSSLKSRTLALAAMLLAPLLLLYPGAAHGNLLMETTGWLILCVSVVLNLSK